MYLVFASEEQTNYYLSYIERINNKRLRDRTYHTLYRNVLLEVKTEAEELDIGLVKVNLAYTSTECPRCGGTLVRVTAIKEF